MFFFFHIEIVLKNIYELKKSFGLKLIFRFLYGFLRP